MSQCINSRVIRSLQITPQLCYIQNTCCGGEKIWTTCAAIFWVLKTRVRRNFKASSRAFTLQDAEILTLGNLHYHSNDSKRTTTHSGYLRSKTSVNSGRQAHYWNIWNTSTDPIPPTDLAQNVNIFSQIEVWRLWKLSHIWAFSCLDSSSAYSGHLWGASCDAFKCYVWQYIDENTVYQWTFSNYTSMFFWYSRKELFHISTSLKLS